MELEKIAENKLNEDKSFSSVSMKFFSLNLKNLENFPINYLKKISNEPFIFYKFCEYKGFVPIELKNKYLEGRKINNERTGHYMEEKNEN